MDRDRIDIGGVRLRPRQGTLEGPSGSIRLEPRVVELALSLVERAGVVIYRQYLVQTVWGGYPGGDRALTTCISKLRSALKAAGASPDVVETFPKRGYLIRGDAVKRIPSTSDRRECIAVLPFRILGLSPDQAYLGEALAEELQNGLGTLRDIRVAARTSTAALAEQMRPLPDYARQLGAGMVLEGSLRAVGKQLTVRLALCSASDSQQLWTRDFEFPAHQIDRLAPDMVRAVAGQLRRQFDIELPTIEAESAATIPATAYQAFLKGRYYWYRDNSNPGRALEFYRNAINEAPDYAAPHAGLVDCYCTYGAWQVMPQTDARRLALQSARLAIALDPGSCNVRFSEGYAQMYANWNWLAAEATFRHVLRRRPDHILANSFLALLLTVHGRDREATELGDHLVAIDPISSWCWWIRGVCAFYRRDFETAATSAQEALDLLPDDPLHLWLASASMTMCGDCARGLPLNDRLIEIAGDSDMFFASSIILRFLCGQTDEALKRLAKLRQRALKRPVSPIAMCMVHSALGDTEAALDAWQAAYDERNMGCWIPACDSLTDPLRADPRFRRIVAGMNLPLPVRS